LTLEGELVWQVALAGQMQLRASFGGLLGFDLPALMELGEAMGVERKALAAFLPYIERGLLAGVEKARRQGSDSH